LKMQQPEFSETDAEYDENEDIDGSNLIVNYLPDEISEAIMYDMFAKYGEVDSVRIIRDRLTQAPRGYGFVKYKHPDSARAAIENLDGLHIMHKKLKVALSRPGGVRLKANLFIGSLPPSFTEEDLTRLFCDFHPIIDVRILRFSDGTSKQCGFVRLDNDDLAGQAIQGLNGVNTDGYRIQVKHAHGKRRQKRGAPGGGRRQVGTGMYQTPRGMPQEQQPFPNYAPTPQSFQNPSTLYDSPSFQPHPTNPNVVWPPMRVPMGSVMHTPYSPQLYTNNYSANNLTPPSGSMMMNQSPIIVAMGPPTNSPMLSNQNAMLQNPGLMCYTPPLRPVMVVTPPLTPNLNPAHYAISSMPVLDLNSGLADMSLNSGRQAYQMQSVQRVVPMQSNIPMQNMAEVQSPQTQSATETTQVTPENNTGEASGN